MRAPWVRQALAYATNRQAVVTQIFKKFNPNQQVLQNLTYGNTQKGKYVPHFGAVHVQPLEGRRDHAEAQLHEGLGRHLRLQRAEDVDQVRHDHRQQAA